MSKKSRTGPWKRVEKLDKGGQGQVFVVEHGVGDPQGQFALKQFFGRSRQGRIDNEIMTTKNLYALGAPVLPIVDEYTLSAPDTPNPWYVTPIANGGNLRSRMVPGQACGGSSEVALDWFERIYRAITEVHNRRVAHRDLKPENILIHDDQIVFCDLGLCLPLDAVDEKKRVTEQFEIVGSRHYFPPEVLSGKQPADSAQFALDYFALGKILYELVSGDFLPGVDPPRNTQYGLFAKKRSEFNAALNVLLDGVLSPSPGVREETWKRMGKHLRALRAALRPTGESSGVERLRSRLVLATEDLLRRREHSQTARHDLAQAQERCASIASCLVERWGRWPSVQLVLDEWLQAHPDLAERDARPSGADIRSMLEGFGAYSEVGIATIEQVGWTKAATARAECTIGMKAKEDNRLASLWLAGSISYINDQLVGLVMIIRKKRGPSGTIDIVKDSVRRQRGTLFDISFDAALKAEADALAEKWAGMVIAAIGQGAK